MARGKILNSLSRDNRIELLSILLATKDKEADRFWTRFNVVVVINSALFTAFLLALSSEKIPKYIDVLGLRTPVASLIVLAGIVVTVLWPFLLITAKHYETRIIKDIDNLIKTDTELRKYVTGYSDIASGTRLWKATTYATVIAFAFYFLWAILLVAKWQ